MGFFFRVFFLYIVKDRGRARTQNGSGGNITNGTAEGEGGNAIAGSRDKNKRRIMLIIIFGRVYISTVRNDVIALHW